MSLNYKEIDLILEELDLKGSHIQKIIQPSYNDLILEIYKPGDRFALYISLEQGKTRIHRLNRKIRGNIKLQRFAQFLRARINGSKIVEAEQLGAERIIKIITKSCDLTSHIFIRLWSGNPNIIITDENNVILDAYYRRPGKSETSGNTYNPETQIKDPSKGNFSIRNRMENTSFNEQIENQYFDLKDNFELDNSIKTLEKYYKNTHSRISSTIRNIKLKLNEYSNPELFKNYAEIIQSSFHLIKKGDDFLTAENFFDNNNIIKIQIDPKKTSSENAEVYFKKYKKAKSGYILLSEDLSNFENQLKSLEKDYHDLLQEEDPLKISEYLKSNKAEKNVKITESEIPGLQFTSGNYKIYVGRSAKENDTLLRKFVKGNDYWLHTRDYPGAYVFIKSIKGKSVPLDILLDAGNLALHYSKAKNSGQAELYYTQVKYLRRAKNGKLGLVIPTQEKNLTVRLDKKRLDRLFNS